MPIIKGEKWINKLFKSKDFSLNEKNHLENRISFYNQENINIGLNNFEVFLIECIRIFRKLFYDHRYYLRYYYSFSPNGFTIQYINDKLRMTIELNCSNTFDIKIIDNSRYWFYDKKKGKNQSFSLNEIKQYFTNFENLPSEIILSNSHDILSLYHHFIETELMPIIKGEMWIDELLKKKGYQQSNYELK